MKVVLCVFLIISFVYLGASITVNIKRQKGFWQEIVRLCEVLISNIGFGQKKLKQIIDEYSLSAVQSKSVLMSISDNINSQKKFDIKHKDIAFETEEKLLLDEFFNELGSLDSFSEIDRIKNYKVRFEGVEKVYIDKYNKFSPLIIKLCLIFGIMLCIVII